MIRSLSLALMVLYVCTACTPKLYVERGPEMLASINIISRDGFSETINNPERLNQYANVDFLQTQPYEKVLRVYGREPGGNIHAYITTYHPNGQVQQYLEILNNSAFGVYQEWHENGIQKVEAVVIGGTADVGKSAEDSWLFDGISNAWDEEGNLLAKIRYSRGILEGDSLYYHTSGALWKRVPLCHGLIEGTEEIYKKDGQVFQKTEYHRGLKNGSSIRYWDKEKICTEEVYSRGYLTEGRYYNQEGELVSNIEDGNGYRTTFAKEGVCELQQFKEGCLDGEVKAFGVDDSLLKLYHVKNGQKHGIEIEYYASRKGQKDLKPILSINWHEGVIQGLAKTWYPNGNMESQREMTGNHKNGISTGWYEDGTIMLIEEYEQNKLVHGEYYQQGEKFPVTEVHDGKGIATLHDEGGNFLQKVTYHNGKPLV